MRMLALLFVVATVTAQDLGPLPAGDARISGRVVDADTRIGVAGAKVELRVTGGGSPVNATTTDASGSFTIGGFAAGAYRIMASRNGYVTGGAFSEPAAQAVTIADRQHLEGVALRITRAVVLAGQVVDEFGDPVDGISVYAQKVHYNADGTRVAAASVLPDRTDDLGQFRMFGIAPGDYLVVAAGRNAESERGIPILTGPLGASDTVPTYYPGTARVDQAQLVSLASGEERFVRFMLSPARPVAVSGVALTSDGRPAGGMRVAIRQAVGQLTTSVASGSTSADGRFTIRRVSPGEYWIDITSPPGTTSGESGAVKVVVDAEDVTGITVGLVPRAVVSGRIVFEGSARPGTFQIQALPVDPVGGSMQGSFSDVVGADGRFVIRNVAPRVFFAPANDFWMTTAVSVDGRELGEEPLDLGGQTSVSGVRVTVTDRLTDVSGVAMGEEQPLAAHAVVFLRLDPGQVLPAQRVRVLKTDVHGRFYVRGLRPGSYAVGVVSELDAGQQYSPDFQDALRMHGRRISLASGEPLIVELGVTGGLSRP